MGAMRPWHIAVLLVVLLLLFGARRLPDLARSVGQSLKIFKSEVKELTEGDPPAPSPPATASNDESGAPAHSPPTRSGQPAGAHPTPRE